MRGDLAVKPLSPCQLDVLAHIVVVREAEASWS